MVRDTLHPKSDTTGKSVIETLGPGSRRGEISNPPMSPRSTRHLSGTHRLGPDSYPDRLRFRVRQSGMGTDSELSPVV